MLVRTYRPRRVLDLGSGVTSHILRALIAEVPGMQVVTTDASRGWLQTTIMELRRDGLSDAHCFVHDAFEASALANEPFDVISVDIFDTRFRRDLSRKLAQWLAPAGVMLLDDWHKSHYAPTMTARLEQLGLTVEPRVDTRDEWGRFVALAYRVAS